MQLFEDRNLNIAVLISASWHIICMFSITPILIAGSIRENTATISFLGSILERVAPVKERPFNLDRVSTLQMIERTRNIGSGEPALSLSQPDPNSKISSIERDKEKIMFSDGKYRDRAPRAPYKKRKERPMIAFKDVLLTGEAMNRMVLYKPDLPKVTIFSISLSSDYTASIRFKISRYGFVENPERIVSSGSSDIDQMAMRYIRRWQFVPQVEDGQEGIIRIRFNAP